MSPAKSLQFYQIMRQGAAILTSIGLAKSGLGLGEIGTWEQLLFIGSTCTFFWIIGLLHSMLPIYPKLDENERKSLIFNAFCIFNLLAFCLFLILFFCKKWVTPLLSGRAEIPFFELFSIWLCWSIPSFLVEHFYLLKENGRAIFWWGVFGFGGQVACVLVPIFFGFGLRESILSLIFLSVIRWIWTLLLTIRWGAITWHKSLIINYLRQSWPLVLNQLAGNFILLFDAWLVGWWFKNEAIFAIFRYGAREFPLALALSTGLATAMIPLIAAEKWGGLAELRRRNLRVMHLVFPAVILLILNSKSLFGVVFNPDFAESAPIFNVFLLTTASRLLMTYSPMMAFGESRMIFKITLVEIFVKISTSFLFIKFWGLPGLAFSTVLAFSIEKGLQALFLRKKHGISLFQIVDLKWFLGYSAGMILAFLIALFQ
jgi:Polysaccharide biosynthesis C-terminal domain